MKTLLWTCVLCLGVFGLSLAGPERSVCSTTFSAQALCGPLWDPLAVQGQWFQEVATGTTYPKTREFHDDDNPLSISGYVTSLTYDGLPSSNIVAFTIQATVLNTLPSLFLQPGTSNSHGEVQMQIYPPYSGPMQEARIAAEFAVATTNLMPSGQPPYYLDPVGGLSYCIVADNETEWAWYCWTPQGPNTPYGAFQVPTWKLGTIPLGFSQTVQMNFIVTGAGMPMLDYRHSVLRYSLANQADVLYNRHNSLKISHWLDTLLIDYGSIIMGAPGEWQGSPEYEYASNVSVFFDEEMELDFGDAQDNPLTLGYPTLLANNGARHTIIAGINLGVLIDAEPDGQPDPNALGDDLSNTKDEDGVLFLGAFIAGGTVNIQVTASTAGYLNAWIDWNSNTSWAEPTEHVFSNVVVNPGPNFLALNVPLPPTLVAGGPHTRWRFTSYPPVAPSYVGQESDGEVEDYEVTLLVHDFGDAPAPYPTLLGNDGARHDIPSNYYLGVTPPDLEPDGQPDPAAAGDDTLGIDDEDGVLLTGSLVLGSNATFQVVSSTNGWLNAWLDYNQNGNWFDSGEQIASDVSLTAGTNAVPFTVPSTAALGQTFGRFRFSSYTGLLPTGRATDGEVEDYACTIYQPKPTVTLAITNITCNASNTVVTIKWNGESPLVYETHYANVLSTSMTWTAWGSYVSSPPYEQTNSISGQTSRFYRVTAPYTAP